MMKDTTMMMAVEMRHSTSFDVIYLGPSLVSVLSTHFIAFIFGALFRLGTGLGCFAAEVFFGAFLP